MFLLHKQDCQDGDYANAGTQSLTTQKLEMAVKKDTLSENKEGWSGDSGTNSGGRLLIITLLREVPNYEL